MGCIDKAKISDLLPIHIDGMHTLDMRRLLHCLYRLLYMPLRQREKKSDHRWQKSPEYELVCSGDYRKWDGLSEGEGTERRVPVYELPRYAYDFV